VLVVGNGTEMASCIDAGGEGGTVALVAHSVACVVCRPKQVYDEERQFYVVLPTSDLEVLKALHQQVAFTDDMHVRALADNDDAEWPLNKYYRKKNPKNPSPTVEAAIGGGICFAGDLPAMILSCIEDHQKVLDDLTPYPSGFDGPKRKIVRRVVEEEADGGAAAAAAAAPKKSPSASKTKAKGKGMGKAKAKGKASKAKKMKPPAKGGKKPATKKKMDL